MVILLILIPDVWNLGRRSFLRSNILQRLVYVYAVLCDIALISLVVFRTKVFNPFISDSIF